MPLREDGMGRLMARDSNGKSQLEAQSAAVLAIHGGKDSSGLNSSFITYPVIVLIKSLRLFLIWSSLKLDG